MLVWVVGVGRNLVDGFSKDEIIKIKTGVAGHRPPATGWFGLGDG